MSKLADINLKLPDHESLMRVGAINSTFAQMFISNVLYLCSISSDLGEVKQEMEATGKLLEKLKERND
ncbi:hypothetical protein AB6A19_02905 [Lactobacillus crispatus]